MFVAKALANEKQIWVEAKQATVLATAVLADEKQCRVDREEVVA
jgi:hypothetical protein